MEAGMLEGDIIISFRNERRRFKLPENLRGFGVRSYSWSEGILSIVLGAYRAEQGKTENQSQEEKFCN